MHLNDLKSSVSVNESFKEYQKATQEMEQVQKEIDQVNQRIQEKQQRIQALEYLRPKSCNCLKAIVEMNAPYPSQAGPRDSSSSQLKNKFSNLDQGDIKQP
jgi:DNA repair ATPase RecN